MSDIKWKMKDHRNCFDLRKDFNLIIMNRNKKIYKTLMGVTLASSLVLSGAVPQNGLHITQVSAASEQNQEKRMIYVDGTKSDSGDGTSKANAVNSLEKAKELSTEGAKILVCGTITISEETTLRMPTQFEVSRAEGFTGPILSVTGKGKVTFGNLEDSATGIKVDGDFLPPYVDLRVSKITDSDIEEVDIEAILKSYEITLWNLKTDEEYEVPEGKKVTVRIPVPEGAQLYESLIIAHYMEEKGEYEYFVAGQNLNLADGYLVFETASFSPFNIGGNQLVGIGTKSPNHKPSVSYYSDATAGSLTMVPAAGNTMASSKTASNSGTKKNSTDSSVKSGIVVASSGIGTNLNRSSSGQSDSSVTPIEKPILLTSQGSGAVSESTTASTSASSNAKTGDSMNLFAWMGTAVASFAIMVKADLTRKRRRKSRKYMKK